LLIGLSGFPAMAQTSIVVPTQSLPAPQPVQAAPTAPPSPQVRLKAIQDRISQDATNGILKPEQVAALEGKQSELANRVARLDEKGHQVTTDERLALGQSLQEQEGRLKHYEMMAKPTRTAVDPSSVPPPTYITPNGTTIIAPGGAYGNSGVVMPQNGPAMNPAPSNLQTAPTANAPQ
jgi:hypothetical protein